MFTTIPFNILPKIESNVTLPEIYNPRIYDMIPKETRNLYCFRYNPNGIRLYFVFTQVNDNNQLFMINPVDNTTYLMRMKFESEALYSGTTLLTFYSNNMFIIYDILDYCGKNLRNMPLLKRLDHSITHIPDPFLDYNSRFIKEVYVPFQEKDDLLDKQSDYKVYLTSERYGSDWFIYDLLKNSESKEFEIIEKQPNIYGFYLRNNTGDLIEQGIVNIATTNDVNYLRASLQQKQNRHLCYKIKSTWVLTF